MSKARFLLDAAGSGESEVEATRRACTGERCVGDAPVRRVTDELRLRGGLLDERLLLEPNARLLLLASDGLGTLLFDSDGAANGLDF